MKTPKKPAVDPNKVTTTEAARITALEARQADLERRIAELERRAAEQVPWPINPYPAVPPQPQDGANPPSVPFPVPVWPQPWDSEPRCPVCGNRYCDMTHYVCNHPQCPSRITITSSPNTCRAETPDHLKGTTLGGPSIGDDQLPSYQSLSNHA